MAIIINMMPTSSYAKSAPNSYNSNPNIRILPAQKIHCEASNPIGLEVLPDKWASGCNRRSFVAVDKNARVVGTCRGIDNIFHPQARTLFLDITPEIDFLSVAIPLVQQQKLVSDKALHLKIPESNIALLQLAKAFNAHFYQACPPYEYIVSAEMKQWADKILNHHAEHAPNENTASLQIMPITKENLGLALEVWVDGYIMQHKDWNATADKTVLLTHFSHDYNPISPALDISRSYLIMQGDTVIGSAQIWPDDEPNNSEITISYLATDYATVTNIFQLGIAATISRATVGEVICIDSHWTLPHEFNVMSQFRQHWGTKDKAWTLLVAL